MNALLTVVMAVAVAYPLAHVVVSLFWAHGHLTVRPLVDGYTYPGIAHILLDTTVVVGGSGAIALVVGSALACLNERTDARMGALTDVLPVAPFLLPPVAGSVGWVLLLSPHGGYLNAAIRAVLPGIGKSTGDGPFTIFSWYGVILTYSIYMVPFVYLIVSAGLRNLDSDLEHQSRICGASALATLRRITLPAVRPSLGAAVFLVAWMGSSLYSIPSVIAVPAGIHVLSVPIVQLLSLTFPPRTGTAVGLTTMVVLFLGAVWMSQRRNIRKARFATLSGKARKTGQVALGRWKWPARALLVGYGLIAFILPALALLLVSLSKYWTPSVRWSQLGFANFHGLLNDIATRQALEHSLVLGVAGATVGILIAAIIALRSSERHDWFRTAGDAAIKLPLTISIIVMAVGFSLAFTGRPFNLGGSLVILFLAYLVLSLPQGSIAAESALAQVGSELRDASRAAGAGLGWTFIRIQLPLMLPGLLAGWTLMFVFIVGEVEAASILAGPNSQVVGLRILDVYTNGSFSQLAALSLMLVVITCAVVAVGATLSRLASGRQTGKGK